MKMLLVRGSACRRRDGRGVGDRLVSGPDSSPLLRYIVDESSPRGSFGSFRHLSPKSLASAHPAGSGNLAQQLNSV